MPKPSFSAAERRENTAAERRVHGALLGYQPLRMKPVHFATSFLLALTRRYQRLEYLNKASVPKVAPKDSQRVRDEYPSERLHPLLVDLKRMSASVELDGFRTLRSHLNAAYNNDGSALAASFAPYSTFGADYSAPSIKYISDSSKNHGHSGSFVLTIFEATPEGRQALDMIRRLLDMPAPPLAALGSPLLDDEEEAWSDRHDELYGAIEPARATAIGSMMHDCTIAVGRLASNLERQRSNYALRYIVLGLCCWLFAYMLRQSSDQPVLLIDSLQGDNLRIRAQSRTSYTRALDLFSVSYDRAIAGPGHSSVSEKDWNVFAASAESRQVLDEHFRDLAVRIGIAQPRSGAAKHKHIELQADTLRVLALSLLEKEQVLTLPEFADQLQSTWSLVVGARAHDGDFLRSHRFGPLDRDDDLRPNAAAFEALLIRLGLAVEPSDGLTLVAINAEELI
ncbi:MAG: hypothetical protein KF889_05775 [Alphaproteobacteria bacterium]|nr:hypothetical protein [Alphaproteobacteria bacterium]MCW5742380.1 hypothetical protein [Alphaproteobacteria bacterium]